MIRKGEHIKLLRSGLAAGFAVIVVYGGYAVYRQLAGLNNEIVRVAADLRATTDTVIGVSKKLDELSESHQRVEHALAELKLQRATQPPSPPSISLTGVEVDLLRSYFKLKKVANQTPQFKIGDKIPNSQLTPTPEFVYHNVTDELNGTKYLIDRDGSLVITADNQVVAIVDPA